MTRVIADDKLQKLAVHVTSPGGHSAYINADVGPFLKTSLKPIVTCLGARWVKSTRSGVSFSGGFHDSGVKSCVLGDVRGDKTARLDHL